MDFLKETPISPISGRPSPEIIGNIRGIYLKKNPKGSFNYSIIISNNFQVLNYKINYINKC